IETVRDDYNRFKELVKSIEPTTGKSSSRYKNLVNDMADKLAGIYNFSVGSELDKLIPDELGSLKEFFIKVISKYFEELHPIVWAQIFRYMAENIFIELPFT